MSETIHTDQFLAHPPAKVWRMLTEPERLARWWAAGDIEPTVGHEFRLDMGGWGLVPCRVTEVEPERLLSYTFGEWTLTWRVVAEGTGTRLFLEHAGFDLTNPDHERAFRNMSKGWPGSVFPRLMRELDGVTAR